MEKHIKLATVLMKSPHPINSTVILCGTEPAATLTINLGLSMAVTCTKFQIKPLSSAKKFAMKMMIVTPSSSECIMGELRETIKQVIANLNPLHM